MIWRKRKIRLYKFFLKILKDCKKDKDLDISLRNLCYIFPNFNKYFLLYYSRKRRREVKNGFRIINKLSREINKKFK
jgi:hypothetical protein